MSNKELIEAWNNFKSVLSKYIKKKYAIWIAVFSFLGFEQWRIQDLKESWENIESIPEQRIKLDSSIVRIEKVEEALEPLVEAADTLPAIMDKAREFQGYVMDNISFIELFTDEYYIFQARVEERLKQLERK